jgi:hypothetical protein
MARGAGQVAAVLVRLLACWSGRGAAGQAGGAAADDGSFLARKAADLPRRGVQMAFQQEMPAVDEVNLGE